MLLGKVLNLKLREFRKQNRNKKHILSQFDIGRMEKRKGFPMKTFYFIFFLIGKAQITGLLQKIRVIWISGKSLSFLGLKGIKCPSLSALLIRIY